MNHRMASMSALARQRAPFVLSLTAFLAACGSTVVLPPQVEDRSLVHTMPPARTVASAQVAAPTAAPAQPASTNAAPVPTSPTRAAVDPSTLPGYENRGKPGYYSVQRGDTLTRIGLEHGQSWRDLARWNQLDNPNAIEVGQVLRVAPPDAQVEDNGVIARPVPAPSGPASAPSSMPPAPMASVPMAASPAASPASAPPAPPASSATPTMAAVPNFAWPVRGPVITGFDEVRNKGLDIAGQAGDPVLAAADGQVVYAGAGLRGYGQLVIIKHNNSFLSAYAHNQKLLVTEDQRVRRGQTIAEMGSTDADRVKLHFEIRREGRPVDPAKFLPAR